MRVRIEASPNQSTDQAEELLIKALKHKREGAGHSEEFSDPTINRLAKLLERKHREVLAKALEEVAKIVRAK